MIQAKRVSPPKRVTNKIQAKRIYEPIEDFSIQKVLSEITQESILNNSKETKQLITELENKVKNYINSLKVENKQTRQDIDNTVSDILEKFENRVNENEQKEYLTQEDKDECINSARAMVNEAVIKFDNLLKPFLEQLETKSNKEHTHSEFGQLQQQIEETEEELERKIEQKADVKHKHEVEAITGLSATLKDFAKKDHKHDEYATREELSYIQRARGGGGGGHVIQETGIVKAQRSNLNFVGATVTDDPGNNATVVTVIGGGSGTVETIVAGDGISVDSTDPANPVVGSGWKRSGNNNYMTTGFIGRGKRPVEAIDIFGGDVDFDLTSTGSDSTTAHIRRARGTYTLDSNDDVIYTDLLPPNAGDTVQSREAEGYTKTGSATPGWQKVVQEVMSVLGVTPGATALLMGAKYINVADATGTLKKFMEHLGTGFTNFYSFAGVKFLELDHTLSKATLTAKTIVAPSGGAIKALTSCALHVKGDASGSSYDPGSNNVGMFFENFGSSDAFYVFQLATGYGRVFEVSNAGRAYIYGNLGIGTLTPTAKLDVVLSDSTISASKSAAFSLVKSIATDNGNAVYANTNTLTLGGAGGHLNAIGTMNHIVMSSASSTANVVRGTYSRVGTSGTTRATSLAMYATHYEGDGTGTIANRYGYTVGSVGGSFAGGRFTNNAQTITNTYGIYIGDLTSGTQTNKPYGVYQDDAGIDNYLNGALGLGVLRATAWLDLLGSSTTRASLRLRPGVAPTSPNDGDVRYTGDALHMRQGSYTLQVTDKVAQLQSQGMTVDTYNVNNQIEEAHWTDGTEVVNTYNASNLLATSVYTFPDATTRTLTISYDGSNRFLSSVRS